MDERERGTARSVLDMFRVSLSPDWREEQPEAGQEATPTAVASSPAMASPQVAASGEESSEDLLRTLASFRDRCRKGVSALLPKPAPCRPRKKKTPPPRVRWSGRLAGRFAAGTPIKRQQRALMLQLGIARAREVIGDEVMQAYLDLFKSPLSDDNISAILALFGWQPETLPMEATAVDGVID